MTLPGLPAQRHSERLDVQIHLRDGWPFPATPPAFSEIFHSGSDGVPHVHANLRAGMFPNGKYFGLFYADGPRFAVNHNGSEVWADWPENYTREDACTYLVGPVMGLVLRKRGTVCLHASAVAIGDRAVAFLGLPGAGKSTAAAVSARAGFPVLSDDIVVLTEKEAKFLVYPGYPRVNLWPDSAHRLFGPEEALPRITPTWDKRYMQLGKNGHHFASSPLPLGAIYILDSRDEALAAPVVEQVLGEQAFMGLVANTYVNYLLDQDMRRTEFDVLSRVVSEIPIRRVRPPADLSTVFDLCEAIFADAKRTLASVQPSTTSARV